MIRDTIEGLADSRHDVCVIGSGPVGISLALELERLGRSVLLLESGGEAQEAEAQALSDAHIVDPARHDDMRIAVARRLGGTSNLWGGRCLPFDPIDFEPRAIVGGALWPIGFEDIAPHIAAATRYACAGAPLFALDDAHPPSGDFSISSLERWSRNRRLQIAHRQALAASSKIDLRLHATLVGLDWSERRIAGLKVATRDGRRIAVPVGNVVLAMGGLESTRLLLNEQRRSAGLFGGPDGPLGRYYMGHMIGEIADIVFASEAVDRLFEYEIDAHASYVRRRFTPTPQAQRQHGLLNIALWPVVPQISDARHGDGFLSSIALALSIRPLGRRLIAEAIRKRHIPDGMARLPHLMNLVRDLPQTALAVPLLLWNRYLASIPVPGFYKRNAGRRYGLSYHSEQAPSARSRVRLARDSDPTGLPRLEIDLRFAEADADSVVRCHDLLASWLERTRLGRIEFRHQPDERRARVLAQASHGTHQIGTARMARSHEEGVVDQDLRVFDAENLYVASSAVLPTSGQANPTLTVMALAMRLAAKLATPR
ncbi:Choline dehydrogenase [Rhizobiales bacterium GAS191]|nr:Choline dehydrogenase [Rhizobiales bacterium GAS191]